MVTLDDLYRVVQSPAPEYTVIGGYENLPSLGPLVCRTKIPWRAIHASRGYYRDDGVRLGIRGLDTSLALMMADDGGVNLVVPDGSWSTSYKVLVEWLKHGGRLCWVPGRVGATFGTWVKVEWGYN
jgi:hypothetical protein